MVTMSWAVVLGGLFCYGTGMVGYLSFREATEGDILDNFTGVVASGFKVMVVMHLVLYIPNEVRALSCRSCVINVLSSPPERCLFLTCGNNPHD